MITYILYLMIVTGAFFALGRAHRQIKDYKFKVKELEQENYKFKNENKSLRTQLSLPPERRMRDLSECEEHNCDFEFSTRRRRPWTRAGVDAGDRLEPFYVDRRRRISTGSSTRSVE